MSVRREVWDKDAICIMCGNVFKASRASKKTCSDTCRKRKERGVSLEDILIRDNDLISKMLDIGKD